MQEDAEEIKQANIQLIKLTNCRASFSAIRVKSTTPLPVTEIMDKRKHCIFFCGPYQVLAFLVKNGDFSSSKLHLMSREVSGFLGGRGGDGTGKNEMKTKKIQVRRRELKKTTTCTFQVPCVRAW